MEDLLSGLASHDVAVIVFFALAFLAAMIVWLTLQWRLHRRTEFETAPKLNMLNRGMSVEEIERVLRAPFSDSFEETDVPVLGAKAHSGHRTSNSA